MGRDALRPDLLVTWPESCDFPLWRRWLAVERDRFEQVIVSFSPVPSLSDLRDHVRQVLSGENVTFLDAPWEGGKDWRDAAVNAGLDASQAKWVWFTEQDFLVQDKDFWPFVNAFSSCRDVIGTRQGQERWHPCCLFVERGMVERTRRDFSVTEEGDHFTAFSNDLAKHGARTVDLDEWFRECYSHMAGLSHNHSLVERGLPVTYKPDEFAAYLAECLREPGLDPGWDAQARGWLSGYYAEKEVP